MGERLQALSLVHFDLAKVLFLTKRVSLSMQTRPPIPKKSKSEQLKDFARAKEEGAREYTASLIQSISETSQGLYGRIKSTTVAESEPKSDSSEKSNTSSFRSDFSSSSDSSSDSMDPFDSEEDDVVFPLPQSLSNNQKNDLKSGQNALKFKKKMQLARSLVGNLVVTPSMKNILELENEDDDSEKDDEWQGNEARRSIKDFQKQFTIAKKDNRVRVSF